MFKNRGVIDKYSSVIKNIILSLQVIVMFYWGGLLKDTTSYFINYLLLIILVCVSFLYCKKNQQCIRSLKKDKLKKNTGY